jgi:hypothetical protein
LGQKTRFGSNEKSAFWLPTVLERFYTKSVCYSELEMKLEMKLEIKFKIAVSTLKLLSNFFYFQFKSELEMPKKLESI